MILITGDLHGNCNRLEVFCQRLGLTDKDMMVVLGDVGANFYLNKSDLKYKDQLSSLGPKMFCVRGNHEERPDYIEGYKKEYNEDVKGNVFVEPQYPNLLFPVDGEIYEINGLKTMVIGGAYSVDKYYRVAQYVTYHPSKFSEEEIESVYVSVVNSDFSDKGKAEIDKLAEKISGRGVGWWKDEQLNAEERQAIESKLEANNWNVDVILSHTCPTKFEPVEVFLSNLDQRMVDKTMEDWLDKIEDKLTYKKWYAGHFHTNKHVNDKFDLLFEAVQEFPDNNLKSNRESAKVPPNDINNISKG